MHIPQQHAVGEIEYEFVRPPDRRSSYRAELLSVDERVIVLATAAKPSKPFIHEGSEVIAAGYWSVWFLFNGRAFDVARFYRPDGTFTGYYADVLEPVHWRGSDAGSLEPMVDLFLDLWITPSGERIVLDEDEFEAAIRAGALTPEQIEHARGTIESMHSAAERGDFPPRVVRDFVL